MLRLRTWIVLVVLGVLAWGHWHYWYGAAERSGRPESRTLVGRAFLTGELPFRAWIPHPHQNLARLERTIGSIDEILTEVARLRGSEPPPRLPEFGGIRLPPSSEMLVASDASGADLLVMADVYPLVGLLSRWAGRLADNPLLAGGRTQIDGRDAEVTWREGSWVVRIGRLPGLDDGAAGGLPAGGGVSPAATPVDRSPALGWLRLERRWGVLGRGEYRIERRGRDLEFLGGESAALEAQGEVGARSAPLPLAHVEASGRGSWRAFGLIPGLESLGGLPGAVAVHRGERSFALPGEKIAELIGDGVRVEESDLWVARALDRGSLARGGVLGAFAGPMAHGAAVERAFWIELAPALQLTRQVAEALEAVPIVGRREARRWRAGEALLSRLAGFDRLTFVASAAPPAARVRLWSDVLGGADGVSRAEEPEARGVRAEN